MDRQGWREKDRQTARERQTDKHSQKKKNGQTQTAIAQ